MNLDQQSRENIRKLEQETRYKTGIGKIDRGECEVGMISPMGCMFCPYGHMLECHYPYTCEEAQCSHYQEEAEQEY